MLDVTKLTDIELRVLIRGISQFKGCKKGISEKLVLSRLESEMVEEANKRQLEIIPIFQ